MNDYLVWSPLYKVDRTKYLYHYTSVEKAFKILYYKTLQFANITTTNDIFEQKPKLSFDETDLNTFDMVRTIQKYFLKEQNRVRILCFSQDYEKDINMDITKKAKNYLVEKGTDIKFGARPLRRAIQRYIEDELSEMILRSQLLDGQTVKVDFENDKLKFEVK